jgi:hypothetical protein
VSTTHVKAAEGEGETPQLNQQGKKFQLPLNFTHFYCQNISVVRILYITLKVRHTKQSASSHEQHTQKENLFNLCYTYQ